MRKEGERGGGNGMAGGEPMSEVKEARLGEGERG